MTAHRRRASDPLSAALTVILLPAVRPLGFHGKSGRLIVRVTDGILQLLNFQRSGFGGGDFCVDYASMLLFLPKRHIVLEPGGRLTGFQDRGRVDRWWQSSTHEHADESMSEVVEAFRAEARPFFESTASIAGLLKRCRCVWMTITMSSGARRVLPRLGSLDKATRFLRRAVLLYRDDRRE